MAEEPKRPPSAVAQSVVNRSESVKDAVAALSDRVAQMEQYLTTLPGRVEAICYGPHPTEEGMFYQLALRLHREGKDWILSYGTLHTISNVLTSPLFGGNQLKWQPLAQGPLRVKMAALQMMPDMLVAVDRSQGALADDIRAVTKEFDANFAAIKTARAEAANLLEGDIASQMKKKPALGRNILEAAQKGVQVIQAKSHGQIVANPSVIVGRNEIAVAEGAVANMTAASDKSSRDGTK